MPFAEFQPGNAGLALPQFQAQLADQRSSLMQRAQSMRVQQEQLELEKQHLAANLALGTERVQAQRAQLGQMRVAAEGARVNDSVRTASSQLGLSLLEQTARAFGTPEPVGLAGAAPFAVPDFHQAVLDTYAMPTETPRQVADFTARIGALGSDYASLAQVHPEAGAMFERALAPLHAKAGAAANLHGPQAQQQASLLRTPLSLVETLGQLRNFVQEAGDRHDFAMQDPAYQADFWKRAQEIRDRAPAQPAAQIAEQSTAQPARTSPFISQLPATEQASPVRFTSGSSLYR